MKMTTIKETWHSRHLSSRTMVEEAIGYTLIAFGSVASLLLHSAWFLLWFTNKLDVNLLTNIVSLEAIFIGVLMLIDGRNKDKQNAAQALHFQETMERIERKLDAITNFQGIHVPE